MKKMINFILKKLLFKLGCVSQNSYLCFCQKKKVTYVDMVH